MSIYDAMISAEEVMDGIQDFIMNMQWQVIKKKIAKICMSIYIHHNIFLSFVSSVQPHLLLG